MNKFIVGLIGLFVLIAFNVASTAKSSPFNKTEIITLNNPWAMTFLPDARMLVTEKGGRLLIITQDGKVTSSVSGVPDVVNRGQGGLGDVVLHPDFADNQLVYLSYVEAGENNTRGAVVMRARLDIDTQGNSRLDDQTIIWRQVPKVSGSGHYGHRLAFDSQGYLFISSGERQKFNPAQDMNSNLGKIVRLLDDGRIPDDNPFYKQGGISAQIWSLGHRNPLGLAFDAQGRLWNTEMGPLNGDELNLVKRGANYGYPIVSNGKHYSGRDIPDHNTRPEFETPKAWWDPTIAPTELIFYTGDQFKQWQGSALIAGLRPKAIIRVNVDGDKAREVERFDMKKRIREIEQGPNGALWVLEDGNRGRLLKLSASE